MTRVLHLAAALGMLLPCAAFAENRDTANLSRTDELCASVASVVPPDSDRPSPADLAGLKGCDSEALYFGIGRKADPAQARNCAFAEAAGEDEQAVRGYSGRHMLMMIYANGRGAKQNIPYAQHLACTSSFAPAERTERVDHLQAMADGNDRREFDYCDDATAGVTGGFCEAHHARIETQSLNAIIDAFAATLSPKAKPYFARLVAQQKLWGEARASNETDLSGTLRSAFEIQEVQLQLRDFTQMLGRLERKPLPRLGKMQLQAANTRMNDALIRLSGHEAIGGTTIGFDGIRQAQTAFLAYRQAWGNFASIAYPQWDHDAAQAWVTMKRADMLDHMAAWLKDAK